MILVIPEPVVIPPPVIVPPPVSPQLVSKILPTALSSQKPEASDVSSNKLD